MTPIPTDADGNDPLARLEGLRAKFLDRLRRDRAAFEQAHADDDVEQQRRIAHGLAGLAGTLGFPAIGEAAFALEQHLRRPAPTAELKRSITTFYAKLDEAASPSD